MGPGVRMFCVVAMVTAYVVGSRVFPNFQRWHYRHSVFCPQKVYCLEMAELLSECSNLLLIERLLTYCIMGLFIVKDNRFVD